MTLFEYISVAVSIVLSFGVVRLLDGLRAAALPGRRYWPHFAWILTKLLNHALYWWGLWFAGDAASWNFAAFLWVLLFPGMLYLQSTALVTTSPGDVPSWRAHSFSDGAGGTISRCRHEQLLVEFAAGEEIGMGTDAAGVDFGLNDLRAPPAGFVRPDHYPSDYMQYVTPLEYFTPSVRSAFALKTGSVFGNRLRTSEPIAGSYMQDVAGTAQGNWFKPGFYFTTSGDITTALALVHDYVDPGQPIMSVGSSVRGVTMGLYSFTPRTGGRINRPFRDVTPDGSIYCYDSFLAGTSAGGVGLGNPRGIVLIQLPTATTLTVEKQGTAADACTDSARTPSPRTRRASSDSRALRLPKRRARASLAASCRPRANLT